MNNTHITSELLTHESVYCECTSVRNTVLNIRFDYSIDYEAFTYALLVGQDSACVYEHGAPFEDRADTLILKSDSSLKYADVQTALKHKRFYVTLNDNRIIRYYSSKYDDTIAFNVESKEEALDLYNKIYSVIDIYDKYKYDVIVVKPSRRKYLMEVPFDEYNIDDEMTVFTADLKGVDTEIFKPFVLYNKPEIMQYLDNYGTMKFRLRDYDVIAVINNDLLHENVKLFVPTKYSNDFANNIDAVSMSELLNRY